MAELEGLYFGMGIDTGQLNSDFINAEKTINQNLRRINQEMEMIQLRGQLKLDGLDESASQIEKVRIQEEALTEQMKLQQDKIVLLSKTYEHLVQTRGKNAEVTRQVELQLTREQHAMEKLETQMQDLSKQTEIAFGINFEMLALFEPISKKIESMAAAGQALPLGLAPAQAKIAAAGLVGLTSVIAGTKEATDELREENPAKLLDEDLQRLSGSIDNSWQKINESNRRGMEQMRQYNREYGNYYNKQNQYYRNQAQAQAQAQAEQIEQVKKEQEGMLESFAKTIGIQEDKEGNFKILPDPNRNDVLRFAKIFEDYRFSESLNAAIDLWKESDSVIGKVASTIAGLYFLTSKAQQPIAEYAEEAINNFRELEKAAKELNLPLDQTNDLLGKINLAGGDYNDVRDFVRGVQDAVIKGDAEDPEVLALEKYGVVIQDSNGKLLDFNTTLENLYQGFLKAREAGEAEAYIIMTNGQAVQDVLPYFEGLAQAEEDVAKIKWSTLDPATLKNASHEMKLLETQTQELKNAISSVFAPAAEMALQDMFEDVKGYTEIIEDNREEIIYWSFVLMEAIRTVRAFKNELVGNLKNGFVEVQETFKNFYDILKDFFADDSKKDISEEAKEYFIPFYEELKKLEKEFGVISKIEHFLPEGLGDEIDNALNEYLVPFYEELKSIEEEFDIINKLKSLLPENIFGDEKEESIFDRAKKDLEEYKKANEEARKEIAKTEEYLSGLGYSLNRIRNYRYELEELKLDIEFGDDDSYQKKIEQNKLWYDRAMEDAKMYADEIAIVEKLNAARLEKLQKEQAERVEKYWEDAADIEYSLTHTAFEKQLRDIARWKEEQLEKTQLIKDQAKIAEETAAITANAAAKEAEAFESAMDRIRGKLQSIEDKIFAIDHSQYENDLRRIQQEYLREAKELQDLGLFTPERKAQLDYLYNRQKQNLDAKAAKGGDYTKPPEGALQRGGNGIMVIGGDQLIDDGKLNQSIGVLVDDSREFAQQLQGLSEDGRNLAIANRQLADSQRALAQASQQATSGFQLIEGDKFVNQPATSQSPQPQGSYQVIGGDQVVAEVQQFGDAVQQAQNPLQAFTDSTASAKAALAEAANSFSPDYFKNLADGTKAVSEMQMRLNESTMKLIDAQDKLAAALDSLPTEDATRRTNQPSDDGMMKLSYRGDDSRYRRTYSDIPPQQPIAQKSSGFKAGFDWDVFGGVGMTAVAGLETLVALGTIAPHPALKVLGLLGAGGLALAKGSYDATTEASNQPAQARPFAEADLSGLITPVINIDGNVQSILQAMQDKQPANLAEIFKPEIFSPLSNLDAPISSIPQQLQDAASYQTDSLRELFGTLPNIEANTGDILRTLQERGEVPTTDLRAAVDTHTLPTDTAAVDYLTPLTAIDGKLQGVITAIQTKEVTVSFETIVTPLSNIHTVVSNILSALSNRQPPNITVSPNISVNLGGAYVFDNAMKRELVDDCTQQIVDNVEQTVRQATSNSSYGYGA